MELYGLYRSPYVVKIVESRRLQWGGYVDGMGETEF
jgi:hypothetical protein